MSLNDSKRNEPVRPTKRRQSSTSTGKHGLSSADLRDRVLGALWRVLDTLATAEELMAGNGQFDGRILRVARTITMLESKDFTLTQRMTYLEELAQYAADNLSHSEMEVFRKCIGRFLEEERSRNS